MAKARKEAENCESTQELVSKAKQSANETADKMENGLADKIVGEKKPPPNWCPFYLTLLVLPLYLGAMGMCKTAAAAAPKAGCHGGWPLWFYLQSSVLGLLLLLALIIQNRTYSFLSDWQKASDLRSDPGQVGCFERFKSYFFAAHEAQANKALHQWWMYWISWFSCVAAMLQVGCLAFGVLKFTSSTAECAQVKQLFLGVTGFSVLVPCAHQYMMTYYGMREQQQ